MKKSRILISIALISALIIFIKLFVFDVFTVEGTSMEPAIHSGQKIYVNKMYFGLTNPFGSKLLLNWKKPSKNQVIVFLHNGNLVVKRCIALEGASLEYSINRDYNYPYTLKITDDSEMEIPLTEVQYHIMEGNTKIPEKMLLAVGDNYLDSVDSRNYGFVSYSSILGKVFYKNNLEK